MGRGYNTLETDDKDEATNQETEEMDGLWVTYRILVMCTGGILPIYTPNILICTCTYSTYCIVLCTWNSHTIGIYEIRSLLKILCDPRGLAP